MESTSETTINITFKLEGDDAAHFLKVKDTERIQSNAEMARALMLRQIDQELGLTSIPKRKASSKSVTV